MGAIAITRFIGGRINREIDFEVGYEAEPSEPRVWRDKNGDGYPGTPAYAEMDDSQVTIAEPLLPGEDADAVVAQMLAELSVKDRQEIEVACLEDAAEMLAYSGD